MYRVLIVDDERLIREGLRCLVDWTRLGFTVAVASDGVEALEALDREPADLVIADIRMPRMDGLELLETLRRAGNEVPFLILSGFAEFEYAQRASGLRIGGYLLKPVDEDELVRRVEDVRRHLDARFTAADLVAGNPGLPPAYQWGRWQLVLLAPVTSSGQILTVPGGAMSRLRRSVSAQGWGEVFEASPYVGLLLQKVFPGGRNLQLLTRDVARAWGPDVPDFSGVAGEVVSAPSAVADSCQFLRQSLAQRFFHRPNTLVWQGDIPGPRHLNFDGPSLTERLSLVLEAGQTAGVRPLVEAAAQALAATASEETVKEELGRLVSGALGARAPTSAWVADLWRQPFLATLVDFLVGHLEELFIDGRGNIDSSRLVERMTEVLETRYAESLRLDSLAEVFHYNPAYLGKLFRSKTGEYFNTALDKVRIRKAQELLK